MRSYTTDEMLDALKLRRMDVLALIPVGSRVYGTAHARSDVDSLVILRQSRDGHALLRGTLKDKTHVDAVVQTEAMLEQALASGSVFAWEAVSVPSERAWIRWPKKLPKRDARAVAQSAHARCQSDLSWLTRRFAESPAVARRRLFHAVRVLGFAAQIISYGSVIDFACANALDAALRQDQSADADEILSVFAQELVTATASLDRALAEAR